MITIISGSNRKGSNSLKIAKIASRFLETRGEKTQIIDLSQLPAEIWGCNEYSNPPSSFAPYQKMILETDGILSIVPEYNGSFPGALKYFIDLLRFPESLFQKPASFIGLSAGVFGGVRPVEQFEMVFRYREANNFGQRVFFPKVHEKLTKDGTEISDEFTLALFEKSLLGFVDFVNKLK